MPAETRLPTGTVSFLFTDIEGSTRLWEAHPDEMRVALASHDAIFREIVPARSGAIFKTVGDAICAAFERPEDALNAAVDAQRRLSSHVWPEAIGEIRVRMGIHTGVAQERDDDYFGRTVNRVARFMSIAHGGQILVSGSTEALLRQARLNGVAFRDLGEHRLKDLSEPEPAFQVVGEGLRPDFPPLTSLDVHPHNLPLQISSFVGRTLELGLLDTMLERQRLITILGPGGTGKTRIALHLAAHVAEHFKDGVWFVELAPIEDPALVEQTVAEALDIREQPPETMGATLVRTLEKKRILLVLDNSEHLTAPIARLVQRLLTRCSNLRIVVTSREPLHLVGEHRFALLPLAIEPSRGADERPGDAAQLFIDRAYSVHPDLRLDAPARASIDRICARVGGIPLAIELAAARVVTFSLDDLDRRLADRFAVLVSRDHTREQRHRALYETIDWSYKLLSDEERRFARRLSVFAGTFTLGGCEAVAPTRGDAANLLDSLVMKSLAVVHPGPGVRRYMLYDMVHDFLTDQLLVDPEMPAVSSAHAAYCAALVAVAHDHATAEHQAAWLDLVAAEIMNVRAALTWLLENDTATCTTMLLDIARYWEIRNQATEAAEWLRRTLYRGGMTGDRRAALLDLAATFASARCLQDEAQTFASKALVAHRALGNLGGIADARFNLAVIGHRTGDDDAAAENYWLALDDFRAAGSPRGEAKVLMNLTLLAFKNRDLDTAAQLLDRAGEAVRKLGDPNFDAHVISFRGALALRRHDLEAAFSLHNTALAAWRRLDNRFGVAEILNRQSAIHLAREELDLARATAHDAFDIARAIDAAPLIIDGHEALCEIAIREGRLTDAKVEFEAAQSLRRLHRYEHSQIRDLTQIEETIRKQGG